MVQSLMAIAAFMAVISGVIFGVSRYEKSTKEDSIELSQPTVTKPIIPEPPASETAKPVATEVPSAFIAEPDTLEQSAEPATRLSEPVESEPVIEPVSEPISKTEAIVAVAEAEIEPRNETAEVILPPEIQNAQRQEVFEPRTELATFTIPPTIQDPKRPNDETVEALTQDILSWGSSKDLKHVSKLMRYSAHADPIVRSHVATSLGEIVGAHPVRADVERSIPVLGKLTNDSDLKVRLYAVQSLGMIRSREVLPYLEKALVSPSGSVMKAANRALQNLKMQYGQPPSVQIAQRMLEKTTD
ncbi:MAG: HEAT repeat domain-containing protein [Leptolyngbya sp. Prado105]|jgi:hypothetical protein|nr:HEAT repeat domain-containing protein [Leptolyngbya sp. Prado105]